MDKKIEKLAEQYKVLAAKKSEIEAELKPVEDAIKEYATVNRCDFDDNEQLKFANGLFVTVCKTRKLNGSKSDLGDFQNRLVDKFGDRYLANKMDEKAIIKAVMDGDPVVIRLMERAKVSVRTVETLKIYGA